MKTKKRYQFGGNEDLSSVLNAYKQRFTQQFEQPDQQDTEDTSQQDMTPDQQDNPDYEELLQKYQDLQDRYETQSVSAQSQPDNVSDYGDSFLNFLFDETGNNDPIDWGAQVASSGAKAMSNNTQPQQSGKFKSFSSPEQGKQALVNQLRLYQTGKTRTGVKPNFTLLQAMSVYAPPFENDTNKYVNFIAHKLGVTPDTPISQIDTNRWADAIAAFEGNTKGNNPGNLKRQFGGISAYNPNLAKTDTAFQSWYKANTLEGKHNIPYSDSLDYDYYSYFRNGDYKNYKGGHFPDTYKKPNHETFSDESIYSVPDNPGGHWVGNVFIPHKQTGGFSINNMPANYKNPKVNLNLPSTAEKEPFINTYLQESFPELNAGVYKNIGNSPFYVGANVTGSFGDKSVSVSPFVGGTFGKGNNSIDIGGGPGYGYATYTRKLQTGGRYKVAGTVEEQHTGLNDNRYSEMDFPMQGMNPFRGLDNGNAVLLTDSKGRKKILTHPSQIAMMMGRVHEKRI